MYVHASMHPFVVAYKNINFIMLKSDAPKIQSPSTYLSDSYCLVYDLASHNNLVTSSI